VCGVLALAALVRLAVVLGPLGWLESDEAIVGLMARHILEGDRPVFYWGQSYLGALEAYSAAAAFALFGSSTVVLKLVPTLYSLGFVLLSYLVARRLFGHWPALFSALYLAVPPTMLAVWSTKPRGGYAEVLFLGEALLLLTLLLPDARRPRVLALVWGVVGGLAVWTHQLAAFYVLPSAAYLGLAMRARVLPVVLPAAVGGALGASPLVVANLTSEFSSVGSLWGSAGASLADLPRNLRTLWRLGIPVVLGLAQPTADLDLWRQDWPSRPASLLPVAVAANVLLLLGLVPYRRAVSALLRGERSPMSGPALLVGLVLVTLLMLPLTKFDELVAEPRYALPLYAAAPLYAALAWRLLPRKWLLCVALAAPLALNLHNLATANPWLLMPTTAGASTPETRGDLIRFLEERDLTRVYADYWLVYPLAFESEERIIAAVMSNGFNRFAPYAHLAYVDPRPAFVMVRDSREAVAFHERLRAAAATATMEHVSIYDVAYDVRPLDPIRP
jgi:4-amino-4-deoxy-L-arabinose transferase-like glycosyltransferase